MKKTLLFLIPLLFPFVSYADDASDFEFDCWHAVNNGTVSYDFQMNPASDPFTQVTVVTLAPSESYIFPAIPDAFNQYVVGIFPSFANFTIGYMDCREGSRPPNPEYWEELYGTPPEDACNSTYDGQNIALSVARDIDETDTSVLCDGGAFTALSGSLTIAGGLEYQCGSTAYCSLSIYDDGPIDITGYIAEATISCLSGMETLYVNVSTGGVDYDPSFPIVFSGTNDANYTFVSSSQDFTDPYEPKILINFSHDTINTSSDLIIEFPILSISGSVGYNQNVISGYQHIAFDMDQCGDTGTGSTGSGVTFSNTGATYLSVFEVHDGVYYFNMWAVYYFFIILSILIAIYYGLFKFFTNFMLGKK